MLAPPLPAVSSDASRARSLALLVPLALLCGAYASQYVGGLYPCEMCWWQRYAHFAALPFAALAFIRPANAGFARSMVALAAVAIAVSGLIGLFHMGVEQKWWEGLTTCSSSGAATLEDILKAPVVRCDEIQWSLFGVSLAGFNALFSLGGAGLVAWLLARGKRGAR